MKLIHVRYVKKTSERIPLQDLELSSDLLMQLKDLGVIEISSGQIEAEHLRRAYRALRLKNCLGVNLAGTAIILDLLERIEELEDELARLKK